MWPSWAFVLFCIIGSITPGPNNIILMNIGLKRGGYQGIPTLLGIAVGFALMFFVVSTGLAQMAKHPLLQNTLTALSAFVLIKMCWDLATANTRAGLHGAEHNDLWVFGFWRAILFQWLNPKGWLVLLAAANLYIHTHGWAVAASHALAAGLIAVVCCWPWLWLGQHLSRWLGTPLRLKITHLTMAALLLLSLGYLVYAHFDITH